jgi:hypothetical protein
MVSITAKTCFKKNLDTNPWVWYGEKRFLEKLSKNRDKEVRKQKI